MRPSQRKKVIMRHRAKMKLGPARADFEVVPQSEIEDATTRTKPPRGQFRVLKNGHYIVQLCDAGGGLVHLMAARYNSADGISWDDLQWIKAQAGYADWEALEIYPRAGDLVNVAAIRHLWILPLGWTVPFGLAERTSTGWTEKFTNERYPDGTLPKR